MPDSATHGLYPLSMGYPRQEYWSRLPFPSPGDLPNPGIKSIPPTWQADSLPLGHLGSLDTLIYFSYHYHHSVNFKMSRRMDLLYRDKRWDSRKVEVLAIYSYLFFFLLMSLNSGLVHNRIN